MANAAPSMGRVFRASVYDGDRELLSDLLVDLEERNDGTGGSWGGTFKLSHPRRHIARGASYELRFADGRSGTIFIVDFDGSPESIDPWVSFRGSGGLR
jgi:hypothetical protein